MVYDPTLLDQLEALEPRPWRGTVWRHMFADYPPDRPNTTGARWNPPETAAIYTSLDRSTAVAEGDHAVAIQPIRPRAKRTVYEVRVQVDAMLDLTDRDLLRAVGVDDAELTAIPSRACQTVGGATAWLERDGLLIPSARADGANLVIFVNLLDPDAEFEVVTAETISDG